MSGRLRALWRFCWGRGGLLRFTDKKLSDNNLFLSSPHETHMHARLRATTHVYTRIHACRPAQKGILQVLKPSSR